MPASLVVATLAGPDGPFHVAVSSRGVVAAETGGDETGFGERLAARFHGLVDPDDDARATYRRVRPAIEAVLAGDERDVTLVPMDLDDRAAFDRSVLRAVREIQWGQTASYGEIARRAGSPRAARAAGGAISRCPISVFIPCHRVIASDGTLGGYGGDGALGRDEGLDHKRSLLMREGVAVRRRAP